MKKKTLMLMSAGLLFAYYANSQSFTINNYAGSGTAGYSGDGGAATSAELNTPAQIAVDGSGNVYIADQANNRVRMVNTSGIITTIAGDGTAGGLGDLGQATNAELNAPLGVAVDGSGNVYIADATNRVRKVTHSTGVINTIAGTGTAGYSGDGGAATSAELNTPVRLALDNSGNLYISDYANQRVRKITGTTISTFAGNGTAGYTGNGSAATAAELDYPMGISFDASGNLYIVCNQDNHIRKVATNGVISNFAGDGSLGYTGDGGAATAATFDLPTDVAINSGGYVFITDQYNYAVRMVTPTGIINTIAGNGSLGSPTYGGSATSTSITNPIGVATYSTTVYVGEAYGTGGINNVFQLATPLMVSVNQTIGTECGISDAAAKASPYSGAAPYTYSWSPSGETSQTAINLAGGVTYTVTVTDNNSNQVTGQITISCTSPRSPIKPGDAGAEDLTIYPNPTQGAFIINGITQNSSVDVYNELGAKVKTMQVSDATTALSVDMSNMPNGIYFVRIIDSDGEFVNEQKIIVAR